MWVQTIRIKSKKPIFFLLIGTNVDDGSGPLCIVHFLQFLKEDLNFLSVGSTLSNQVEALRSDDYYRFFFLLKKEREAIDIYLCIFNRCWRVIAVE